MQDLHSTSYLPRAEPSTRPGGVSRSRTEPLAPRAKGPAAPSTLTPVRACQPSGIQESTVPIPIFDPDRATGACPQGADPPVRHFPVPSNFKGEHHGKDHIHQQRTNHGHGLLRNSPSGRAHCRERHLPHSRHCAGHGVPAVGAHCCGYLRCLRI